MDTQTIHEKYMRLAIDLAKEAAAEGEVPVGAVVVKDDTVIGYGRNRREVAGNALAHAELEAIHMACRTLGGWQLVDCTLYVTLEPCPMCAGAVINSRIAHVVVGARNPKAGSCGSIVDLFQLPYNHKPKQTTGVLEEECQTVLKDFFRQLRQR